MKKTLSAKECAQNNKDANACIAAGAGLGILSAGSAALIGAVCPLCVVLVPGLLGLGAYKRWSSSRAVEDDLNINTPPTTEE